MTTPTATILALSFQRLVLTTVCSKDFKDSAESRGVNMEKEVRGVASVPGLGVTSGKSLDVCANISCELRKTLAVMKPLG